MNLYYEYAPARWEIPLDRAQVSAAMTAMCKAARTGADIELHLIDDAAIAALNSEFLQCVGPTNIITFPPDEDMGGLLYLSADCLTRESRLYGQDMTVHFLRLLAHGFGHLAGLDHGAEMAALERKCLDAAITAIKTD